MKLFLVQDAHQNDKFIFAWSGHHAAEQYIAWQMISGAEMGSFSVKRVTLRNQSPEAAKHLREALALGANGMGRYHDTSGWIISPIEDARDDLLID